MAFEDKGKVVAFVPEKQLTVTHFSATSGQDDRPENYHTVDYRLKYRGDATALTLTQDGNGSDAEAEQASATWLSMLEGLKRVIE